MSSNSEQFLQLKDENFDQWSTQMKFFMLGQGLLSHLTVGIDKIKIHIQRTGAKASVDEVEDEVEDEIEDEVEDEAEEEAEEDENEEDTESRPGGNSVFENDDEKIELFYDDEMVLKKKPTWLRIQKAIQKDRECMLHLSRRLGEHTLIIANIYKANECWEAILNRFQRPSDDERQRLREALAEMRLTEDDDITKWVNTFELTVHKLEKFIDGKSTEMEDAFARALGSKNKMWIAHHRAEAQRQQKKVLTYLFNQARFATELHRAPGRKAAAAHIVLDQRGQNRQFTPQRCQTCGQSGHVYWQCPKLVCPRCKKAGHVASRCDIPCRFCKKTGHSENRCVSNKGDSRY